MPTEPDQRTARPAHEDGEHGRRGGPPEGGERVEEQADDAAEGTVAEPPTGEDPGPGPDADDPMDGSAPTG